MNYLGVFGVWNDDLGKSPPLQNILSIANTDQVKAPGEAD